MDVSFGNENPFKDGIVATDTCKSPEIIDTEGKSKPLDFESFLTSVSDVNKISGKGSELNLPVTTTPCLDTIIGSVVGRIELHKFDSINNLTISSNLIENPSVASKNITEHSSSNYDFFYLEKIGSNESPVKEIEKNSSNSEFKEFASCGVDVCRRVDSSTAALLETDNVPSNDILREKKKENIEVQLNHKKIESEKLVDESNEMLTSCEVNNIELEKKSLEFQNNEEAGISIYTSVGQSLGRTNDIVNAHAIFDGQFQGSDDCVTGLSTDDRSDQTKICAIMPSKDSVNSMEIDRKLLESNSNKTPFSNLNNTVVKFEFGEEQVIESEINESKVKENSNESYCNLLTNGEKPKNQSECEVLKGIDNDIILSEKDTDVINSKDKCPSDENKLHSLSDMKASEVVLDRLKPHILKRPLLFSNLNPNEILQSDVEKDESLITDCEEKSKRKLNGTLITKNIQSVIEEENLNSQETGNQVDIIEKHNSESKNEEHSGVEKNTNHSTNDEEEMLNRCSNSIKCSTSTQLNVDDSNEIFKKEQEDKTLSSDNIIKGLDENLLNQQKSCEKRNSSEGEIVVETDLQCNRLQKSKRKLKGNLTTENIQSVIEEENLNIQETGNQVDIMEKHNSESKNEEYLGVEKNTNHSTDDEEMLNRCSNSIKCSTSTQLNLDDSNEVFKKQQEDKTLSSDNIIKGLDEKILNQQKSCEKKNSSEKLVVETDLQCHSESNSSFESELFNSIDGNSSNCQIANSYNESDKKTRNSSLMIKPCIVVLKKLNFETLKMYSLDKYPSSNFISKCDSVFCSDKGEMLMDSCLSIFPENQEDDKIALKKIQNESSFKRKEKSHQKFNSSLRNEEVNFKSPKIVSSKISKGKKILTEFNKNTSGHVLDSSLIKEQKDAQEKVLKGTSKRDSTHMKNLKQAKRSGKLDEVTVIKRNKKRMHKSSTSMILNIESNDINKNIEQKSKKVKYDKKEFNDLKVLYSIKECKIALEQLDSTILARYLNQVPQVFQSNQYNVDSNINACIGNKIVHIDRDGKGTVECQKHLLKKHGTNKISKECVQSTKLKKKLILKTNPLLNARSKRNSSSPFLKMNSSKPGIASYNSGEMEATGGTVLSSDSQDNSDLNFVSQVSVIDDNRVETNRLIKEQILMKRCNVKLEQCDSAILEKYLGNDWSKSLPQRVNLMDFEDSLPSNSASDVFSEFGDDSEFEDSLSLNSASDAFSDSESIDQMDLGSDSDNRLSFEQELEFHEKKDHKDLICKSCNRKFKTYSSLLSHEKKTHETYPFKCVLCKQCFKERCSFMNHMKRNHPEVEPYVCDYSKCEESFQTKKRLSDHKKSHQKYCCRFCKKRYGKKIFLQRHVSDCH